MHPRIFISAAALCFAPSLVFAQSPRELPPIIAEQGAPIATSPSQTRLSDDDIARRRTASPDALSALKGEPGFALNANGGVSGLPSVRGLGDDRILTTVDGAPVTSFCPNHMNPASAYIQTGRLARVTLTPTLSPVSAGGDNIGGVIALESASPTFSESGEGFRVSGRIGGAYRSVSRGWSGDAVADYSGEHVALRYDGSYGYAANYKNGDGQQVRSTAFESYDQALTIGARSDAGDLITLRLGRTSVPYEGFPTQRMDMTANESTFANLTYARPLGWGDLSASVNWRSVDHEMNFLADKSRNGAADMPMISQGDDVSAQVSVRDIAANGVSGLSAGGELFRSHLDDYWPPVAGSMMMGPGPYININDGDRTRLALWGEWTAHPAETWTTTAGLRFERVEMDAGAVSPYGVSMMQMADVMAAAAFNARNHARNDDNVDATLTALWRPADAITYEFGAARKTRSPNPYERYSWGRGAMSSSMTSFAGDANAYIGDIDLEPEIAHSLAATARFGAPDSQRSLTISAYHTWVKDFIDADYVQDLPLGMGAASPSNTTFVQLQFANHDATLYGFEISGRDALWSNAAFGEGAIVASLSYTHGVNEDTGDALYHIAPLMGHVTLEQRAGRWTNAVELELAAEKDRVNNLRHEPPTGAYALTHIRTSATFGRAHFDLGVENLFDAAYALPLGGVSYGDYVYAGGGARPLNALPGPGRSINIGLNVAF